MKNSLKWWDIIIRSLLIIAALGIVVFCLIAFSSKELTTRESTLLGIFLTVFSLLASWIITHWYAGVQIKEAVDDVQERNKENLRTYALKASEKVNNLSSELNKLAVYLEDELNYTEYHSKEDELLAKEERLESAIHIIRTLKSVNDTSLSDWQGVIGDELEELREEQAEKEEEFQNLISRLEDVVAHQNEDMRGNFAHTQILRHEIESLRKDLRMAIVGATGSTLSSKSIRRARKEAVNVSCPKCASEIKYNQRPEGGFKAIQCSICGSKYISSSSANGFVLEVREPKAEFVKCPQCQVTNEILVDNAPGSFLNRECSSCHKQFRITRSPKNRELVARIISVGRSVEKLDAATIDLIRKELPPQPWLKGTHIAIAQKLGLSTKLVSQATQELIRRGVFLPQVSGILYAPVASAEKNDAKK